MFTHTTLMPAPVPEFVLARGEVKDYKTGDRVFQAQVDADDRIFVIESGLVKVTRVRGNEEALVRLAGPGEIIGEEGLLLSVRTENATAVAPSRVVAAHCNPALDETDQMLCRWALSQVAMRLRLAAKEMEWIQTLQVHERIRLHIGAIYEKTPGREIPVSQAELGQLVGATRETVSTILNQMARQGIIRLGRRSLAVLQPEALAWTPQSSADVSASMPNRIEGHAPVRL